MYFTDLLGAIYTSKMDGSDEKVFHPDLGRLEGSCLLPSLRMGQTLRNFSETSILMDSEAWRFIFVEGDRVGGREKLRGVVKPEYGRDRALLSYLVERGVRPILPPYVLKTWCTTSTLDFSQWYFSAY